MAHELPPAGVPAARNDPARSCLGRLVEALARPRRPLRLGAARPGSLLIGDRYDHPLPGPLRRRIAGEARAAPVEGDASAVELGVTGAAGTALGSLRREPLLPLAQEPTHLLEKNAGRRSAVTKPVDPVEAFDHSSCFFHETSVATRFERKRDRMWQLRRGSAPSS